MSIDSDGLVDRAELGRLGALLRGSTDVVAVRACARLKGSGSNTQRSRF